ncbi:DsbA family protein [Jannaschia sp. KMU-145]|uniref:DsbA family protein n=1 Tax=Jannaschia halovivens TaxID=3388667 RepID=UPI00396B2A24
MTATPRRNLLVGLLALGGGYAVLRTGTAAYGRLTGMDLAYEPMEWPEGFRKLVAGSTSSGGFDPFVGLDAPATPDRAVDTAAVEADPCGALFGGPLDSGIVPIASFSDYNCPFCRVLTQRLAAYEAAEDGVRVVWHELPILGDGSRAAARAALAAKRQGAYVAFHERLMRSPFEPTDEYLRVLAADLGIDADRLAADMASDAVADEIATSLALARGLATVGTPVLVIGRTVIEGAPDMDTIKRIVAEEREQPPICA